MFASSEPLYPLHRREIEERFRTKLFDLYGQAERVAVATECEKHAGLHVNPEYGILEILKEDGTDAHGEDGEIVGTGLNNDAMPLIRYRTGDRARFSGESCACGRQMPLIRSVEGRVTDVIRTPEGRVIPGGGVMVAFHGIQNIRRSQIIQETLDAITVKIEKDNPGIPVETEALKNNLKKCLGSDMRITFQDTASLWDGRAKFRWVVSCL